MASEGTAPAGGGRRKVWLDWQRGLAVLFMVEWHAYDAWVLPEAARGGLHQLLQVVGGFAAPSFLYMAGLSQVLGDAAMERKGIPAGERRRHAIRRALWLLGVAYLFRVFEYVVGGAWSVPGGHEQILKVDILNVIAVSLLLTALVTAGVPARRHAALAVAGAAAFALLAPVVAAWQHPPSRLLDYLYADWPRAQFHLFNWAAFAFAGSAVGRLALGEDRPLRLLGLAAALFLGGWLADRLPPFYAHQEFWRTSPSWFAMRLGGVMAMSAVLQALPAGADGPLSWLRTMGRHSMLGYFVSIEIPYGILSWPIHKRLGMGQSVGAVVAMLVLTWAVSAAADRWDAWRRARRAAAAA
ncbi:MAG TPA: heparan-alpha-glucosaminide N-acetyltransferase domain-containing protein [Anaeromyxobacteraceae bacterium]|nr:heparan-alpha-glucosaminide N-acetyltransferase domain-containing protein [Anaeromyxobacteraceae bacterium]